MKLSFWAQFHSCSKTVFRTIFLISSPSRWNFLSWHQHTIIITFWEVLQHSIERVGVGNNWHVSKFSANSLLSLWKVEGMESFTMALNCFYLFSTPLGKLCIALDLCTSPIPLDKIFFWVAGRNLDFMNKNWQNLSEQDLQDREHGL